MCHDISSSGSARGGLGASARVRQVGRRGVPGADSVAHAASGAAEHHGPRRGRAAAARRHAPRLPADAPPQVQQAIWAANEIQDKPYVYGGGHGDFDDDGYDCSGTVSYALHGAGLLETALDSGSFMKWGEKGPGTWITVYTNPGHAYAVIAGLRLDTSAASVTRSNTRKFKKALERGPRWRPTMRSSQGLQGAPPARLLEHPTSSAAANRPSAPKAAEYAWSDSISPTTQGREVPWPACPGGSPQ